MIRRIGSSIYSVVGLFTLLFIYLFYIRNMNVLCRYVCNKLGNSVYVSLVRALHNCVVIGTYSYS